VVCQVGALADVAAADLLWRGGAAIALADLLERAGYRVTLWAAGRSRMTGGYSVRAVRLKAADEPVNAAALANAISGWCYRLVWLQEHAVQRPDWARQGSTTSLTTGDAEELAGGEPCYVIQNVYDREAALRVARAVVASLSAPNLPQEASTYGE